MSKLRLPSPKNSCDEMVRFNDQVLELRPITNYSGSLYKVIIMGIYQEVYVEELKGKEVQE